MAALVAKHQKLILSGAQHPALPDVWSMSMHVPFDSRLPKVALGALPIVMLLALAGCGSGSDGAMGAAGATGATGAQGAVGPQGPQGATGPAGLPAAASVITTLARNNFSVLLHDCSTSPGVPGNGATGNYTYCDFSAVASMTVNWFNLNLSHGDLSNVDMTNGGAGGNFQTVDFSFAKLTSAKFDNGNLQNVDFSYADLTGATFVGANEHVTLLYTICPDGTNSGPAGGTCVL